MNDARSRAHLRLNQNRPDLAADELRRALAADPDDGEAHALLALCHVDLGRPADALREARAAVRSEPDLALAHLAHAHALREANALDAADDALTKAIALDPYEPSAFALRASLDVARERWAAALESADEGLALDPEHAGCLNARAIALRRLRRPGEAAETIEGALARDPENAYTHANAGWARLEASDADGALEHFREALRLDPTLETAQEGILEALKARHVAYRVFLRYGFWMQRLTSGQRWGVLVGLYFVVKFVPGLAFVYAPLVLFGWLAGSLFDAVLLLSPFGRAALSPRRRRAAAATGVLLVVAVAAGAWAAFARSEPLAWVAVGTLAFAAPLAAALSATRPVRRWVVGALAAGMALVGAFGALMVVTGAPDVGAGFGVFFAMGFFAFSLAANLIPNEE